MSSLGSFLFSNLRKLELRGGTLSSTRGQGPGPCDGALLCLASQDESCVRTEKQLNLHLGLDAIYHSPLLGWLLGRVTTTGLHHPYTTRVLLSPAAQHRPSGQGALVGGGSLLHEREGLLFAAGGGTVWSGEKHPLRSCCGFFPVAGMCSEWGPTLSEHHHNSLSIWGMAAYHRLQVFNADVGIASGCGYGNHNKHSILFPFSGGRQFSGTKRKLANIQHSNFLSFFTVLLLS